MHRPVCILTDIDFNAGIRVEDHMLKRVFFAALLSTSAVRGASPAKTQWTQKLGNCSITFKTNCPDARAKVGDTINITVSVNSPRPGFCMITAYQDGIKHGKVRCVEFGTDAELNFKAARPGSVSATCALLDGDKRPIVRPNKRKAVGYFGVIVEPEKLVPGNPERPADFDAFWAEKRAELDAVPVRADREEVELPARDAKKYPDVVCYDVKVDCSGNAPVSGYLCMPRGAKPKSLPAIVHFHGAGVRSAKPYPIFGRTAIAFDINAHGIDNGKPESYYKELYATGYLKDYRLASWEDHRSNYFAGMFVRVMRALDYVKSLPEWDGQTLVVSGGSQGGAQSLAAAALDSQVTLCVSHVPSLCDLGAGAVKRRPGGPLPSLPLEKQRDPALIREAAYVDLVFFANRIKCPVYLAVGLGDNTCIATSSYIFYNALPESAFKRIAVWPNLGHTGPASIPGRRAVKEALKMK
jgi:cephalosporin-C deacetylase-like acetyl esterase